MFHFYRPQTKFAKVMFLHMSVCPQGGGVCPIACWDTHPRGRHPLGRPPLGRHPPGQTPPGQTPPGQTPPCVVHAEIWSTSGWYASYWNAILFINIFRSVVHFIGSTEPLLFSSKTEAMDPFLHLVWFVS